MWSYLKTVMIDFPSRLLAAARGRRGCATTGLGMRFTLERIALRSGAEHVGGVHRVEIFLDRLNLAVTHHEEKVIEVLVGLAVFHLGIRFGLDRDPLALGCYAFGGEPETTVNLGSQCAPPISANCAFVFVPERAKLPATHQVAESASAPNAAAALPALIFSSFVAARAASGSRERAKDAGALAQGRYVRASRRGRLRHHDCQRRLARRATGAGEDPQERGR